MFSFWPSQAFRMGVEGGGGVVRWILLVSMSCALCGTPYCPWLGCVCWITLFTNKPVYESHWSEPVVRTPTLGRHQMILPLAAEQVIKRAERFLVSSRYADCCNLLPSPRTPVQSRPRTAEHAGGTYSWSCRSDCCHVAGTVPESSSSRCGPAIPKPWIPNARYLSAFPYEATVSLRHTAGAQDERLLNNRILMRLQATLSTP